MLDQYTPTATSREVRELRRELQAAREEIDRLHDHIRDVESDLCMAQPRQPQMPQPRTVLELVTLWRAKQPDFSIETFAEAMGTTTGTVSRIFASIAEVHREEE